MSRVRESTNDRFLMTRQKLLTTGGSHGSLVLHTPVARLRRPWEPSHQSGHSERPVALGNNITPRTHLGLNVLILEQERE